MCIAITKPAGIKPDYKAYKNGYDRNPDGWGFAVPDRHKKSVIIRKNTTSFKDFWKQFKPFRIAQLWCTSASRHTALSRSVTAIHSVLALT